MGVYYTEEALGDLRRIHRFLRPKNPRAAERAVRTIRESVWHLQRFPDAGRTARTGNPDHRELIVPFSNRGYIVLYGVDRGDLVVFAIWHQREAGY